MKRLGMLLVLVSACMFTLGCAEAKKEPPKKDPDAAAAPAEGEGTEAPAEGTEEKPAEGEADK